MTPPPLCIIQARYNSTRLPGKMLLKLGNETLIARAWRTAREAFGVDNCVVAIPKTDENGPLGEELRRINARIFAWKGSETDVLSRFYQCAATYRWASDSVIVRYTPDDWRKDPSMLRRVANGERVPVELGGEAIQLDRLQYLYETVAHVAPGLLITRYPREHLSFAFSHIPAPPAPEGCYTIDTQADYEAACEIFARQNGWDSSGFRVGAFVEVPHP